MWFWSRRAMAGAMGTAAPGVVGWRAVAALWPAELASEAVEVRSQRPSIRPRTALESLARTGDPLWPRVTG